MKIKAIDFEIGDRIIRIRPDGSIHMPFGWFNNPKLEVILIEAKAFQKYLKSRNKTPKQTKKPLCVEWKINVADDGKITTTSFIHGAINPRENIKRKVHKYEFDVPLKNELVWIEWKPKRYKLFYNSLKNNWSIV